MIQKVVNHVLDRQTLYFTVAIFFPHQKHYTLFQTTRTKLAATAPHWRLLTSPIVEKICVFLMQIQTAVKNVLDHQTICFTVAFFHYEKQYTFSKNSNETRRNWGRLAAPDFANSGKKTHVASFCKLNQS